MRINRALAVGTKGPIDLSIDGLTPQLSGPTAVAEVICAAASMWLFIHCAYDDVIDVWSGEAGGLVELELDLPRSTTSLALMIVGWLFATLASS